MGYPGLDRNLDNVQALGKKRVLITPRFQLNGVSAPTLLSDTFGGKLIRAVQGGFLLTCDTAVPDILNVGAELEFQNPGVNPAIYNTGTTYTLIDTTALTATATTNPMSAGYWQAGFVRQYKYPRGFSIRYVRLSVVVGTAAFTSGSFNAWLNVDNFQDNILTAKAGYTVQ